MDRRNNRSARLKKYEAVYKEYIKQKSKSPKAKTSKITSKHPIKDEKINRSERKLQRPKKSISPKSKVENTSNKKNIEKPTKVGRKKLTEYQKFVKKESQKEKYKNLKPEERLVKIAKSWKKYISRKKKI